MTTGIQCEKCKGTGLEPRDGGEADKDIHPILSREPGLCTACGGSGQQPVTPRRTGWRFLLTKFFPYCSRPALSCAGARRTRSAVSARGRSVVNKPV